MKLKIENADQKVEEFLQKVFNMLLKNLEQECGTNCTVSTDNTVIINIKTGSDIDLKLNSDEAYNLVVDTKEYQSNSIVTANITSVNVFGARNAIETFSQLVASYRNQEGNSGLIMVGTAKVQDSPTYNYRGVLLDTARNYLPIEVIKRQINGMAASKLNVLHWHITDSQSFPLVSKSVPSLTK